MCTTHVGPVPSPYDFLRACPGLPVELLRVWWCWCWCCCCVCLNGLLTGCALLLASLPAPPAAAAVVAAMSVLSVLLLTSDSALPAVPLLAAVAVPLTAGGSCFEGAPAPAATELCAASASLSRSPAEGRRRIGGRLASAAIACVAASFMSSLIALQQQHRDTCLYCVAEFTV